VHGAARGADECADWAAFAHGMHRHAYPADWKRWGSHAGPLRNQLMFRENPDIAVVFAFHDDYENSKGTAHAVGLARKFGIPVKMFSHS
jgi:hypothetical protein